MAVHVMKNCEPLVLGPALAWAQSDKKARGWEGNHMCYGAHHREEERSRVLERESFVFELFAIDGFASGS